MTGEGDGRAPAGVLPDGWERDFDEARDRYEAIRADEGWTSGPASLLGVLDQRRSEVVHSTILRWLLDPTGGHGLGTRVLRGFLERVPVEIGLRELALATVKTEVATLDPEAGRAGAIDVVIGVSPDLMVLVEVKLWATETNDQLDRYAAAHLDAHLVYLTPFGSRPRRDRASRGRWRPLAWHSDVLPLLREVAYERRAEGRPVPALDDYVTALTEELRP